MTLCGMSGIGESIFCYLHKYADLENETFLFKYSISFFNRGSLKMIHVGSHKLFYGTLMETETSFE